MTVIFFVILAALAVLGLCFLFRTVISLFFPNKTAAAVIIEDKTSLKNLDILLEDAREALFIARRGRTVVLLSEDILAECDEGDKTLVRDIADSFGAEIYVI
jgi:hypothetical protein